MKVHVELIFIWKVSHLDSFWNRGTRELGNGLFASFIFFFFLKLKFKILTIFNYQLNSSQLLLVENYRKGSNKTEKTRTDTNKEN